METNRRNTALLLIGAGLYLGIGHTFGFVSAGALVLAALGFTMIRETNSERKDALGIILLLVSVLILFANHWGFMIAMVLAAIAWFLYQSRSKPASSADPHAYGNRYDTAYVKQHIVGSIRWGRGEAWACRSSQLSVAVAEIQIDFTNAILEEPDTFLHLQGIIGDVDIVVPEDIGLTVHAEVLLGEVQVAGERGAGIMNKMIWRSPNMEAAEHRVHLTVSYVIADVDVKVL